MKMLVKALLLEWNLKEHPLMSRYCPNSTEEDLVLNQWLNLKKTIRIMIYQISITNSISEEKVAFVQYAVDAVLHSNLSNIYKIKILIIYNNAFRGL